MAKFSPPDAKIYSLDLNPPEIDPEYSDLLEKITFLRGNSLTYDFLGSSLVGFDLVFVDGDHSPEFVSCDTRFATAVLKDSGFIVWHDWNNEYQVGKTVKKLFSYSKNQPQDLTADLGCYSPLWQEVVI
jgi:hypothetical protein